VNAVRERLLLACAPSSLEEEIIKLQQLIISTPNSTFVVINIRKGQAGFGFLKKNMWQKLTLLNTFFNYIHLFKKIAFFVKLICIFMFFFPPPSLTSF
jgi:hypothetical protein